MRGPRKNFLLFRPRLLARESRLGREVSRDFLPAPEDASEEGCPGDGAAEWLLGICRADVGHEAGCQVWTCSPQDRARLRSPNAWTGLGRSQVQGLTLLARKGRGPGGVFEAFVRTVEGRALHPLRSVIESARLRPGKRSMATVSSGDLSVPRTP